MYYCRFSSEIGPLGYAYQENLFKIEPTPCKSLKKVKLSEMNYSPDQLEDSMCYEINTSRKMGYFDEGEYKVIGHICSMLRPCEVTAENDCQVTDPEGNAVDTSSLDGQLGAVSEFFRDYRLEVDFIQDTVDFNNFDKPIQSSLAAGNTYSFDPRYLIDQTTQLG